jgi:hypothetical protein
MTDEMVILGMSLSHLRDVNKSQSDGLALHFLDNLEVISHQFVIHFLLSQS